MARLPVPGSDNYTWGEILNAYLRVEHNEDGTLKSSGTLSGKVSKSRRINSGTGLSGGGNLTVDRTLSVKYGTTAGTAAQGNDSRIVGAEQQSNLGQPLGYAPLGVDGTLPIANTPRVAMVRTYTFMIHGDLTVGAGPQRYYNDSGAIWSIDAVRANVGTVPTGASVIIDVNISGTSVFPTQANRPTIAIGAHTSGKVTSMEFNSVLDDDYITIDVDQIGSSAPGSDLIVQIDVT